MIKVFGGVALAILIVAFFGHGGTVDQLMGQIGALLQPLVDLGAGLAENTTQGGKP